MRVWIFAAAAAFAFTAGGQAWAGDAGQPKLHHRKLCRNDAGAKVPCPTPPKSTAPAASSTPTVRFNQVDRTVTQTIPPKTATVSSAPSTPH